MTSEPTETSQTQSSILMAS